MAVLLIITTLSIIIFRYRAELEKGYRRAGRYAAPARSRILPVPAYYRTLLEKYFRYYQALSPANKKRFEQKVCQFIYAKQFIPRNMKEVPIEMVVFIAATAVQLTFGLPRIYLQHFNKILIYPDRYYSSITKQFHKGEVNPAYGIIVLSWEGFKDGFLHAQDAINLGLHEMAHALRLENIIRNSEYQFFDESLLQRFDALANDFCNLHQNTDDGFFRSYACTNVHEFFSVAVENFFERPAKFHAQQPELYLILTKLLNQNPMLIYQQSI